MGGRRQRVVDAAQSVENPMHGAHGHDDHGRSVSVGRANTAAARRIAEHEDSLDDRGLAQTFEEETTRGTFLRWDAMTPEQRLEDLMQIVNAHLTRIGVPVVRGELLPDHSGTASFRWRTWAIFFDPQLFTSRRFLDILHVTLYHEARHAEQLFRVARLLASSGMTAVAIHERTGLPNEVIAAASQRPLREGDPGVEEARRWLESLGSASDHAAQKRAIAVAPEWVRLQKILYDPSSSEADKRQAFEGMKRVLPTLLDYVDSPLEADANLVEGTVNNGSNLYTTLLELEAMTWSEMRLRLLGAAPATPDRPQSRPKGR